MLGGPQVLWVAGFFLLESVAGVEQIAYGLKKAVSRLPAWHYGSVQENHTLILGFLEDKDICLKHRVPAD
jgi:hypothetical protein